VHESRGDTAATGDREIINMPRRRGYTRRSWDVIGAYDRHYDKQFKGWGQKIRSSKARVGAAGHTENPRIIAAARAAHYALLASWHRGEPPPH
jgi:hypothetical protein